MNPIASGLLKLALPMIEKMSLDEWNNVGKPDLVKLVAGLQPGSGQEEAQIVLDALDKIVQFEASRPVAS